MTLLKYYSIDQKVGDKLVSVVDLSSKYIKIIGVTLLLLSALTSRLNAQENALIVLVSGMTPKAVPPVVLTDQPISQKFCDEFLTADYNLVMKAKYVHRCNTPKEHLQVFSETLTNAVCDGMQISAISMNITLNVIVVSKGVGSKNISLSGDVPIYQALTRGVDLTSGLMLESSTCVRDELLMLQALLFDEPYKEKR